MRVSIIAPSDSGKTIFFGLFYQEMEHYANENPNRISYYMPPKTTEICLKNIRNPLQQGEFPKKINAELEFYLEIDPPKKGLEKISSKFKKSLNSFTKNNNSTSRIALRLFNISNKENKFIDKKFVDKIVNSNVLVIIINGTKFSVDNHGKPKISKNYDSIINNTLSTYLRKNKFNKRKSVDLITVLTQLDQVNEDVFDYVSDESSFDFNLKNQYEDERVNTIGKTMIKNFLPETGSTIEKYTHSNTILRDVKCFFSWIESERDGEKIKPVVDLKSSNEKEFFTNIYPNGHYRRFINYLGELNNKFYS